MAKKIPAVFSLLVEKASGSVVDLWSVRGVLGTLLQRAKGTERPWPDVHEACAQLFAKVMPIVAGRGTALEKLIAMKIAQILLPDCLGPQQLLNFLQTVCRQRSVVEPEYKEEYCILVASIMAKTVQIAIPRRDLAGVEATYQSLLGSVLQADDGILALCLHSITLFMMFGFNAYFM